MRRVRKTIVLTFAALGAYRAWELLRPRLGTNPAADASRDTPPSPGATPPKPAGSVATPVTVDLTREEANASSPLIQTDAPRPG
jgi:hypothetical protein